MEIRHNKKSSKVANQFNHNRRKGKTKRKIFSVLKKVYGNDLSSIAQRLEMSEENVRSYATIFDSGFLNYSRKESYRIIKNSLERGISLEEIADKLELSKSTVSVYKNLYEKENIKRTLRDNKIIQLANQGYSLEEITNYPGINIVKQSVHLVIKKYGEQENWKRARISAIERKKEEKQRKIKLRKELISTLKQITINKGYQQSWHYGMAMQYYLSKKRKINSDAIPIQNLITLFSTYENAKENGELLSLYELSVASKIHFVSIGRILKYSSLDPMHGRKNRRKNQATLL